jgi:hypothetical protein
VPAAPGERQQSKDADRPEPADSRSRVFGVRARRGELIQDLTLLTLAFAIALGSSLYQLAHGVGTFVDGLTTHLPGGDIHTYTSYQGAGLTWIVGHRILVLDGIVTGLVELAVVIGIAAFVRGRFAPRGQAPDTT